jgi:hypothetical protein
MERTPKLSDAKGVILIFLSKLLGFLSIRLNHFIGNLLISKNFAKQSLPKVIKAKMRRLI